ncbi:hypothetical protein GWI34_24100 [Actinomadura sp. DSM 109109]|nr:hypothetical protein [Actinomadura lepetitiana]
MAVPDEPQEFDSLIQRRPVEDAGAATARWYMFQYRCATRHCLEMIKRESGLAWILCEWHTDYILGWRDGTKSIASIKSREPDSGYWTIARLFSDGGLGTLYERWSECGRPQESRWLTNGGLDQDCRTLRDACSSKNVDAISVQAANLKDRFKASKDDTEKFLQSLRIYNRFPNVEYFRALDIEEYCRPLLASQNLSLDMARPLYDGVYDLVTQAAAALGEEEGHWLLASQGSLDEPALLDREVQKRFVTRRDVLEILQALGVQSNIELPNPVPGTTRLTKKLIKGNVVPSAIAAARRARREWTQHEYENTPPIPSGHSGANFGKLRAIVTSEASESQRIARQTGELYGDEMLNEIQRRVGLLARDIAGYPGLDSRLLMGLVYDLTARCEIWWSDWFDVDSSNQESA